MDKKYGHYIFDLGHTIRRYIDYSLITDQSLTGLQSRVLHYIYEKSLIGEVLQKDIENFFGVRRSTITYTLQGLEDNEYIKRLSSSSDARIKVIKITEKGIIASENGRLIQEKTDSIIESALGEEELQQFMDMINKVKQKFIEKESRDD